MEPTKEHCQKYNDGYELCEGECYYHGSALKCCETQMKSELTLLKEENQKLRGALEEIYRTLSSDDTTICQTLPEHDSFYKDEKWLAKTKELLTKAKNV